METTQREAFLRRNVLLLISKGYRFPESYLYSIGITNI